MKQRVCYILPRYDENDATHAAYLTDFIERAADALDICFIIGRGGKAYQSSHANLRAERLLLGAVPFLKHVELGLSLIAARLLGYRNFYIHYSFAAAFLASILLRPTGARIYYWNCGEPWKFGRSFARNRFERFTYHAVSFLVTGAEKLKEQYARHYRLPEEKILVMPNWVDLEKLKTIHYERETEKLRQELNIFAGQKIALFVHRLSARKGSRYLPDLARCAQKKNAVLVVVGDGPDRRWLEQTLAAKGLADAVRVVGDVPNRSLAPYYGAADVFVMPSREEGFPHVVLEAMAYGVPLIVSDAGAVKEIVPPQLRPSVIPEGETSLFCKKMEELLDLTPENKKAIADVERAWVARFDITNVLPIFINLFKRAAP